VALAVCSALVVKKRRSGISSAGESVEGVQSVDAEAGVEHNEVPAPMSPSQIPVALVVKNDDGVDAEAAMPMSESQVQVDAGCGVVDV